MTNISDDVALGELPAQDATTPKDFDFESWLTGARKPRTAVRIFQRPDLQARIEEIRTRVGDDDLADDEADALADEFEQIKGGLLATSLVVTIEQRSPDWVKRFRTETIKALGGQSDGIDPKDPDLALPVNLAQASEQIISPELSEKQLHRLAEINPAAVGSIVTAMHVLNQTGGTSRVESPDFSRRRSGGARR